MNRDMKHPTTGLFVTGFQNTPDQPNIGFEIDSVDKLWRKGPAGFEEKSQLAEVNVKSPSVCGSRLYEVGNESKSKLSKVFNHFICLTDSELCWRSKKSQSNVYKIQLESDEEYERPKEETRMSSVWTNFKFKLCNVHWKSERKKLQKKDRVYQHLQHQIADQKAARQLKREKPEKVEDKAMAPVCESHILLRRHLSCSWTGRGRRPWCSGSGTLRGMSRPGEDEKSDRYFWWGSFFTFKYLEPRAMPC